MSSGVRIFIGIRLECRGDIYLLQAEYMHAIDGEEDVRENFAECRASSVCVCVRCDVCVCLDVQAIRVDGLMRCARWTVHV